MLVLMRAFCCCRKAFFYFFIYFLQTRRADCLFFLFKEVCNRLSKFITAARNPVSSFSHLYHFTALSHNLRLMQANVKLTPKPVYQLLHNLSMFFVHGTYALHVCFDFITLIILEVIVYLTAVRADRTSTSCTLSFV